MGMINRWNAPLLCWAGGLWDLKTGYLGVHWKHGDRWHHCYYSGHLFSPNFTLPNHHIYLSVKAGLSYLLKSSAPSEYRNGMLYLVCYLNIAFFGSFGTAFTIVQGKAVRQRFMEEGRALPWYFSSIVSNILAAVGLTALSAVDLFVTVRLTKLAIIIYSIIGFHDAILNPNRSSQQNAGALLHNIAVSCYIVIAIMALLISFILLRRRPCRSEFLRMYYQALKTSEANT